MHKKWNSHDPKGYETRDCGVTRSASERCKDEMCLILSPNHVKAKDGKDSGR